MPIPRSTVGIVAWLGVAICATAVIGAMFGFNPAGLSAGFLALFLGAWLLWLLEEMVRTEGGSLASDVVREPLRGVRPGRWRTSDLVVNGGAAIAFVGILIVVMGVGWEANLASFLGASQVPVGLTMVAIGLLAAVARAAQMKRDRR
jgi:hypothetical protein